MSLDVKVEVAFATSPDSTSPTWTDVSSYVDVGSASVEISRGRGDLYDQTQPGSLSLTFDNSDGRFTAGYSGGAYYPNVVLGKRIRVSFRKDAGTWRPRFDGFVDSWPTQWAPTGTYAEARVTAVDRMKRLSRVQFVESLITSSIVASGPSSYWPMADPEGTVAPANRTGRTGLSLELQDNGGSQGGTLTFGSGTGPGTDGQSAAQMAGDQGQLVSTGPRQFVQFDATHSFSVEFFVATVQGEYPSVLFFVSSDGDSNIIQLSLSNDDLDPAFNHTWGASVNSSLAFANFDPTSRIDDGRTHHIAMVCAAGSPNGTVTLYLDGAVAASGTVALAATEGRQAAGPFFALGSPGGGVTIAHFAIYETALSATDVANRAYLGGLATGEDTGERFEYIADLAELDASFYTVTGTPGTTDLAKIDAQAGQDALSMLQDVTAQESGLLYVSTSGVLTFLTRSQGYNQTAVATLTAGQYEADLTFLLDDNGLVNDFTTTDGNGDVHTYQDTASIAAYGRYSDSATIPTSDGNQAESYSQMRVVTSQPAARVAQVTVELMTQQSLADTLWQAELLGSRLTLSGLPSTAPASSVDVVVQGYSESFSLAGYSLTANTTPAPATVWVLGDSTYGVLGSTTRLAY